MPNQVDIFRVKQGAYAEAAQAFIAAMTQIGSDRATQAAQIAEGYGHAALNSK